MPHIKAKQPKKKKKVPEAPTCKWIVDEVDKIRLQRLQADIDKTELDTSANLRTGRRTVDAPSCHIVDTMATGVRSISNRNIVPVRGITTLNDELFVIRSPSNEHIEVYDSSTFALRRHLAVTGLSDVIKGLASCAVNNCLYVSDSWNDAVHRVALAGDRHRTYRWQVDRRPMGLSVNTDSQLLICFWTKPFRVHEYTTGGTLIREIRLQSTVAWPSHAQQLATGQLIVSHGFGDSLHRVCVVDGAGRVAFSHGGKAGSAVGQFNGPKHIAVDVRSGSIIVADGENNRLVALDCSLNRSRDLKMAVNGGLLGPYALHFDEWGNRLYVGEWIGGRVHVMDNVLDLLQCF